MNASRRVTLLLALLLALPLPALAERYQTFDEYQVHYNAVPTGVILPDVASAYDIVRSRNRGLLTVSVLREGRPVPASVDARAVNHSGRLREIDMHEVREGNAIYYIGTFGVSELERLTFEIAVRPDRSQREQPYRVSFVQRFFTDL